MLKLLPAMYERVEVGQSALVHGIVHVQPVSLFSKHFTDVIDLQFVMSVRNGVFFCGFSQHCAGQCSLFLL